MEERYGMTADLYRAVTTLVDDRMREITVTRQDHDRLAQGQVRLGVRMDRVEAALARLAEAQAHTEEELRCLTRVVGDIQERQKTMQDRQAAMKSDMLEIRYRERAGSYFGAVLRRVRAFVPSDLEKELEPRLSLSDYLDVLQSDLLVRGQPRKERDVPEVWLAVEVSAVVDRGDVERAVRRARHLREAGYLALPAVAGEQATQGAEALAGKQGAVMVLDGRIAFWEEALALTENGEMA